MLLEKIHNIQSLTFEGDNMLILIDNQLFKISLFHVSSKLAGANKDERNNYIISPSGYGIHWPALDEDLSVNGLLQSSNSSKGALNRD